MRLTTVVFRVTDSAGFQYLPIAEMAAQVLISEIVHRTPRFTFECIGLYPVPLPQGILVIGEDCEISKAVWF